MSSVYAPARREDDCHSGTWGHPPGLELFQLGRYRTCHDDQGTDSINAGNNGRWVLR